MNNIIIRLGFSISGILELSSGMFTLQSWSFFGPSLKTFLLCLFPLKANYPGFWSWRVTSLLVWIICTLMFLSGKFHSHSCSTPPALQKLSEAFYELTETAPLAVSVQISTQNWIITFHKSWPDASSSLSFLAAAEPYLLDINIVLTKHLWISWFCNFALFSTLFRNLETMVRYDQLQIRVIAKELLTLLDNNL